MDESAQIEQATLGRAMNLDTEQVAELLAGIARSQQAIIDAIESESGGWRNTHLLPKLTTAANLRLANARLHDIPSRILLRSQGRIPMDVATIIRALEEATTTAGVPATISTNAVPKPVTSPMPTQTSAPAVAVESPGNEFGNFFDT
jgi:hypothetical protein